MADNINQLNSTGNTEIDSTLDSFFGNNNTSNQANNPPVVQGKGINFQQLIGGILQAGSQGLNAAGNFVNPQQTEQSPTGLPPQAIDAANKVLNKKYTEHAENIAASPDGMAVLQNLINNHNASQQVMQQPGQSDNAQSVINSSNNTPNISNNSAEVQSNLDKAKLLQSQQILAQSQPKNFLQRFADNLSKMEGGMTSTDRIGNVQTLQKLAGGEQIQPLDAAKMSQDAQDAAIKANGELLNSSVQHYTAMAGLVRDLNETKGPVATTLHTASPQQIDLLTQLSAAHEQSGKYLKNQLALVAARSQNKPVNIKQNASNTSNMIKAGQSTTINGKTVRRIN